MGNHDFEGHYILEKSMNPAGWKFALFLFALGASFTAVAEEEESGISFSHEDWEVVCDNTLTCRMAGYCPEEEDTKELNCGSVLITRAAGPNTPLRGEVRLEDSSPREKKRLTLWIDGEAQGELAYQEKGAAYSLTPVQIRALLAAARRDDEIRFAKDSRNPPEFFTLSGRGVSAVMLKMDEIQGRIDTPGALIQKGEKPESNVYPPRPAPVIRAAKVSHAQPRILTRPEVVAIVPLLGGECNFDGEIIKKHGEFVLRQLDEEHVLISTLCWIGRGGSENYAYWVIDAALKGPAEFVADQLDEYYKGALSGIVDYDGGDCFGSKVLVWDGRKFRQSDAAKAGMCRRKIGFWGFPTFVTRIVTEDGSPHVLD
jgi:hypothetical protein